MLEELAETELNVGKSTVSYTQWERLKKKANGFH